MAAPRGQSWSSFSDLFKRDFVILHGGVADSVQQIADFFPDFVGEVFTYVMKREKSHPGNPWAWKDYGTYIGKHPVGGLYKIQYLHECDGRDLEHPLIDIQYVFSFDPTLEMTAYYKLTRHELYKGKIINSS